MECTEREREREREGEGERDLVFRESFKTAPIQIVVYLYWGCKNNRKYVNGGKNIPIMNIPIKKTKPPNRPSPVTPFSAHVLFLHVHLPVYPVWILNIFIIFLISVKTYTVFNYILFYSILVFFKHRKYRVCFTNISLPNPVWVCDKKNWLNLFKLPGSCRRWCEVSPDVRCGLCHRGHGAEVQKGSCGPKRKPQQHPMSNTTLELESWAPSPHDERQEITPQKKSKVVAHASQCWVAWAGGSAGPRSWPLLVEGAGGPLAWLVFLPRPPPLFWRSGKMKGKMFSFMLFF